MITIEELKNLVCDVIKIAPQELTPDKKFKQTHNWDSIAMLRLLNTVESTFQVKLQLARFLKAETINDIYNLILDN